MPNWWTPQETSMALQMLDEGASCQQVSDTLGRTLTAVHSHLKRVCPKPPTLLTATQVAARLGTVRSVVGRLIADGHLHADRRVPNGRYYITPRAVEDFIRYSPERYQLAKIVDPKLAVLASAPSIRSDRMLTLSEAANILSMSRNNVGDMVRAGILPSIKPAKGGVPAVQGSAYRVYVPRQSVEQLLFYRNNWLTTRQAALVLKYSPDSIANICRQQRLRSFKIGGEWYIDPKAVTKYKEQRNGKQDQRTASS